VELLITGTRGYSRTERLLLGSVSEKLFRQARCPVLVVPERASVGDELVIRRILCPIDFSPDSSTALAFASSIARHYGSQLILMHVIDEDAAGSKTEKTRIEHEADHRLRGLLDRDQNLPFESRIEIDSGVPGERISRTAAEYRADLVILPVHAASEATAHEPERTAYKTIRWSPCPVLTIPGRRSVADSRPLVSSVA
jgi:nucleotide-binding universal stress UspA family protein